MFVIVGFLIVIGGVVGGYLLEHGHLAVLLQPAELVIIGGAALGTVFIANPISTVVQMLKGLIRAFGSNPFNKAFYLDNIKMLSQLFNHARKEGLVKLEADADEPSKSQIFTKYPKFMKNHHALHFVCDTLRTAITGGANHFDLDHMMEQDIETHHKEAEEPVSALSTVADSLPGLGIVAAVLGVVITMGALGGPPEEIGHKVAAALVGTFLGILLCYGFIGPLAANMKKYNEAELQYFNFLRVGLVSFVKGISPILAVEFARRVIPSQVRPSFKEMEAACKGRPAGS